VIEGAGSRIVFTNEAAGTKGRILLKAPNV